MYQIYTKTPTGAYNLAVTTDTYEEAVQKYVILAKSRKLTDVFISEIIDMHVDYCPETKQYQIVLPEPDPPTPEPPEPDEPDEPIEPDPQDP